MIPVIKLPAEIEAADDAALAAIPALEQLLPRLIPIQAAALHKLKDALVEVSICIHRLQLATNPEGK